MRHVGKGLNVFFVVAGTVVTDYLPVPTGMEGFIIYLAAISLAAGSGIGWICKEKIQSVGLLYTLLSCLVTAIVGSILYFVLAQYPGLIYAIGLLVCAAISFASIGVIFAIAGIKIDE